MIGHGWHDTNTAGYDSEFPLLSSNLQSKKKTSSRRLCHPAKRPRIEKRLDDSDGLDNFPFLESLLLEEQSQDADDLASFQSVISELCFDQNELPDEEEDMVPTVEGWDLLPEFDTMPKNGQNKMVDTRIGEKFSTESIRMPQNVQNKTADTRISDKSSIANTKMPQNVQNKMADTKIYDMCSTANSLRWPSIESSCTYSPMIDELEAFKGPAVLVLTSFPYRVFYANDTYSRLTKGKLVVGESIFGSVEAEGVPRTPPFGSYPKILAKLLHGQISGQIVTSAGRIPCKIKTCPVMESEQGTIHLRSYLVVFEELNTNVFCLDEA
eukprot:scaffold21455_cov116-Cylindrotheca_fusiformis.AAC.6